MISVEQISAGVEDELLVVLPLSSSRAPSPLRPRVSPEDGVDVESAAICRGIRSVPRRRLLWRIGQVTPQTLGEVERALGMILGIDHPHATTPGSST